MVKIVSDSTCDLSKELIDRYDISIIPLHIVLGENEYKDVEEISADEIYQWVDEKKMMPKTSAPGIEEVIEVINPIINENNEIIMFCISESMSTTGNVFRLSAEEIDANDKISVINSENLSTGIGHLVIEASIMAKEGKSRSEIVKKIEELKSLVSSSFVVDTLDYLHRGGRCSSISAFAGGKLKLHPMIEVKDGAMLAGKKYRGKMSKVIVDYVKDMENELKQAKSQRVFITHSGCEQEIINIIYEYLKSLNYFEEILITRAGGVISSHCGRGTLGVLYIK